MPDYLPFYPTSPAPPPPPRSDILFEVFPEQNLKLKETKAKTTFLYNDK